MIENNSEKKKLFYMIVLLLTLITMIIGATLAYFALIASQKEEGTTLYTDTLQISYIDGVYIRDPELYPIRNVNYNTFENVYRNRFSVASNGTLEQTISIDMAITRNDFTENALKYVIYNSEGTEMARGIVPTATGVVNLADNMYLAPDGIATYTIIIWWDNTGYNQNAEMGSRIDGKFIIYSKQLKA